MVGEVNKDTVSPSMMDMLEGISGGQTEKFFGVVRDPVPLEDLLRLGDDGGPADHHDAEAPRAPRAGPVNMTPLVTEIEELGDTFDQQTIGEAEQKPPFDPRRTIAEQVKAMPVLTYWGMTERGYSVFRQANGVGGYTYWSDEIGGGVRVWDTSLASRETLQWCINLETLLEAEARANELKFEQDQATGWGAAYGVRGKELKRLNSTIDYLREKLGFKR